MVDEQARLALLARLNETLGEDNASTLMAALPAHDWHDLATKQDVLLTKQDVLSTKQELKQDLAALEGRLRIEMENVEHRVLTALHRELTIQTRIYVLAIVTTVIALSSVALFGG